MPVEESSLKRLQYNCSVMLDRYVAVARVTCEMVCTLQELPLSKDRQLVIYLQKRREDEALAAHDRAARELLTALGIQPDLPVSKPTSKSIPPLQKTPCRRNQLRGLHDEAFLGLRGPNE